jgi:hypothetical protein
MKRFHIVLAAAIFVTVTFQPALDARAQIIGCPTGQAVRGIDADTGKLICAPAGGTAAQLVDRDGVAIGQYMGHGIVSREIEGYRVDICCITTSGTPVSDASNAFLYASADCQGTPYFFADPSTHNFLFRIGSLVNSGDIVFNGDPATTITPLSYFSEFEGCVPITETGHENLPVQPVVSVPLSALGAPPFKVQ